MDSQEVSVEPVVLEQQEKVTTCEVTAEELKYSQQLEAAIKAGVHFIERQQKRMDKLAAETEKFIEDHLKHETWWEANKERILASMYKGKYLYLKAPQRGY